MLITSKDEFFVEFQLCVSLTAEGHKTHLSLFSQGFYKGGKFVFSFKVRNVFVSPHRFFSSVCRYFCIFKTMAFSWLVCDSLQVGCVSRWSWPLKPLSYFYSVIIQPLHNVHVRQRFLHRRPIHRRKSQADTSVVSVLAVVKHQQQVCFLFVCFLKEA